MNPIPFLVMAVVLGVLSWVLDRGPTADARKPAEIRNATEETP